MTPITGNVEIPNKTTKGLFEISVDDVFSRDLNRMLKRRESRRLGKITFIEQYVYLFIIE